MSEPEKKKKFYVNNKQMFGELIKHSETGEISDALGEMFMSIAARYTSTSNFMSYTYRDDMVSDAIYRMITQIDKFDINHPKANPFSYFTMIAKMSVIARIKKEKKISENNSALRTKVWKDVCLHENMYFDEYGDHCNDNVIDDEYSGDYIDDNIAE
jgi:DNA-directed RNA polymerase specialized sigma24 family protein